MHQALTSSIAAAAKVVPEPPSFTGDASSPIRTDPNWCG
jgi:hypothetical protein